MGISHKNIFDLKNVVYNTAHTEYMPIKDDSFSNYENTKYGKVSIVDDDLQIDAHITQSPYNYMETFSPQKSVSVELEFHDKFNAMGNELFNPFWCRPVFFDDFYPNDVSSFAEHAIQNAYNSAFFSNLWYCDYDMWWSNHSTARSSGMLRAISGGPMYLSDKIGESELEYVLPLVDETGRIYKCDDVGKVTGDMLFQNPIDSKKILKIFNKCGEYAEERGRKTVAYIKEHYSSENVEYVDLKGVIDVETLWNQNDVDNVVEHFNKQGVDSIVLIPANFGNEEAAGELAKKMNKPVLLWGPQDDTFYEDGGRHTDTQCGIFAMSRQLLRMNVKFTYIVNCPVESEILRKGLDKFARVTCAVKNFVGMRIGQVGLRPKPFCSVIFNEGQLMEDFDIHVIQINLSVIQTKFNEIMENRKAELKEGAEKIKQMYIIDADTEPNLEKMWAFVIMYKEFLLIWIISKAVKAICMQL